MARITPNTMTVLTLNWELNLEQQVIVQTLAWDWQCDQIYSLSGTKNNKLLRMVWSLRTFNDEISDIAARNTRNFWVSRSKSQWSLMEAIKPRRYFLALSPCLPYFGTEPSRLLRHCFRALTFYATIWGQPSIFSLILFENNSSLISRLVSSSIAQGRLPFN